MSLYISCIKNSKSLQKKDVQFIYQPILIDISMNANSMKVKFFYQSYIGMQIMMTQILHNMKYDFKDHFYLMKSFFLLSLFL